MTTHRFKRNDGPWNTLCGRLADPKKFHDGKPCGNCARVRVCYGPPHQVCNHTLAEIRAFATEAAKEET